MKILFSAFWNSDEHRIRAIWRVMLELICAVSLVTLFLAAIKFNSAPTSFALQNASIMAILLGVALLAARVIDGRFLSSLGLDFSRRSGFDLLGGFAVGAVLVLIVFLIQYQLGWTKIAASELEWSALLKLQLGRIVTIAFVACAEEVMFRGYQFKNLSEGLSWLPAPWGIAVATVIVSVIFGVVHGANPSASLTTTLSILLAGAMFCIGRICTGGLAAPIGLHFAWNYGIAAVLGLPVSGMKLSGSLFESETVSNVWTGGEFGPEASPIVLVCMVIGTLAFVMWPAKKTSVADNVRELRTFVPRAK